MRNLGIGISLLCVLCANSLFAQGDSIPESSNSYLDDIRNEYSEYRQDLIAEYADFLSQSWTEYNLFKGIPRVVEPKPIEPIICAPQKNATDINYLLPISEKKVVDIKIESNLTLADKKKIETISNSSIATTIVDYFGATLQVHYASNRRFKLNSVTEDEVSNVWKVIAKSDFQFLCKEMAKYYDEMQLNDWAYLLMTQKIVSKLPDFIDDNSRIVFQHFLLVASGYDVRIARVDEALALLVPVKEEIYETPFMKIGNQSYYLVAQQKNLNGLSIYTCNLPSNLTKGQILSLHFNREIKLPMMARKFNISNGTISVNGAINENNIKFYKEYPQCRLSVYALAPSSSQLLSSIENQLSLQVKDKSRPEAIQELLSWVQKGFNYKTDIMQFGHEKTFFVEENFFYPYSDCEDRAILFAYVVKKLIGNDVILLDYPGHVATAVNIDEQGGDHVMVDNKKYIVCDPTYIGASIGKSMADFRDKKAKIIKLNYK